MGMSTILERVTVHGHYSVALFLFDTYVLVVYERLVVKNKP